MARGGGVGGGSVLVRDPSLPLVASVLQRGRRGAFDLFVGGGECRVHGGRA